MKQNVLIKTVVTQQFKDSHLKELEAAHAEAKQNLERLKSSLSQVILRGGVGGQYDDLVKAQLQEEKANQERRARELEAEKAEVSKLELDSVYVQGALEGTVEVKMGDNLFQKLRSTSVLIKDGVILSIE
jgi:beta-galactosidase/beta-glucuronidase